MSKRDRTQPFTREEFLAIEQEAIAAGDERLEQMAGVLIDTEAAFEKMATIQSVLLENVRGALALGKYSPEGSVIERAFARLQELVEGLTTRELEPELHSIHWEHGTPFEMKFKTNWASMIVAASLSETLRKEDGSYWNHVTMVLHYKGESFEVAVQRKSGKTPKQILDERTAERDAALARVAALEEQLGIKGGAE